MLIITGLGRCGTSFVTKILQDLDFHLGVNVSWIDDVNAGLELGSIHRINSEMYFRYLKKGLEINLDDPSEFRHWSGLTFRYILTKFDKDKRQGDFIDVIKDPRLTWHPGLIRTWWSVRKDFKLLILHRDPELILKSRLDNERIPDPKDERMRSVKVFKIDFCDFLTEVLKLEIPYQILYYPNFCYKPETLLSSLNSLCRNKIPEEDFYDSFERIFDENKIHQKGD
jgi:hypothetical protein